jgi:uracil-DNA glycosylase
MKIEIEKSWKNALSEHLQSAKFKALTDFIKREYKTKQIYPEAKNIFRALNLTPLEKVRVVIIGQDPYHGKNQAQGLSFSVPTELRNPPSLQNIFKELELELGKKPEAEVKFGGDLSCWAKQGVLLLNAVLTVEAGKAGSHANRGWEDLTDEVIRIVSEESENIVFMLWGAYARKKKDLIDNKKHLILESTHPSPFSAHSGFFGSGHFAKANRWLKSKNLDETVW